MVYVEFNKTTRKLFNKKYGLIKFKKSKNVDNRVVKFGIPRFLIVQNLVSSGRIVDLLEKFNNFLSILIVVELSDDMFDGLPIVFNFIYGRCTFELVCNRN